MQVLIDPVCMFTVYPQLLRNFVYRLPRLHWRLGLNGVIDTARYLFSRNLIIAETFGRKFAWHKVRAVCCVCCPLIAILAISVFVLHLCIVAMDATSLAG